MEFDRALELAVISSWEELVTPDESCSLHVVYENISDLAVNSVEVWKVKDRGYEGLVCRYSIPRSNSSVPRLHFANGYHSEALANILDFIMRNQCQLSRPSGRSVHGLVQIDRPTDESKKIAAAWSDAVRRECSDMSIDALKGDANSQPEEFFSQKEKTVMSDADQAKPNDEQIRRRAYEIYEARGCQDGKEFDDWVTAEKQVTEQTSSVTHKTKAAKAG